MITRHYFNCWRIILSASTFLFAGWLELSAAQQPEPSIQVIEAVAPQYPPIALAANAGGEVIVEVVIDSKGAVSTAKVINGHPLLVIRIEKCAQRWRFEPEKGNKAERKVNIAFAFRIMPEDSLSEEMSPIFKPPYKVEVRGKAPDVDAWHEHPGSVTIRTQRKKRRVSGKP